MRPQGNLQGTVIPTHLDQEGEAGLGAHFLQIVNRAVDGACGVSRKVWGLNLSFRGMGKQRRR